MQGHTAFNPFPIIDKLPFKIEAIEIWGLTSFFLPMDKLYSRLFRQQADCGHCGRSIVGL
jgi:hypothetical protein